MQHARTPRLALALWVSACAVLGGAPASAWSPPPQASLQRADLRVHAIVEGDTPTKLQRLYKLKPEAWAALNGLDPTNLSLRLGKGLLLPDGPTTSHLPRHVPPTAWKTTWGRCEAQPWPALAQADPQAPVWCAQGSPEATVCHDADTLQTTLEVRGQRLAWDDAPFLGTASLVLPFWLNLDADPAQELLVATLKTASNGIGVEYWGFTIFDDLDHLGPPLRFTTQEFGRASLLRGDDDRCELLLTRWESASDPILGEGLYFVGQRAQVQTPALELRLLPGLAARRYDDGEVWSAKYAEGPEHADTAALLSGPGAWAWPADPALRGLSPRARPARVTHAERGGDEWELSWRLRLAPSRGLPKALRVARLGDEATQQRYPDDYAPPNIERTFPKRAVSWQPSVGAPPDDPWGILWLAPAAPP
jgi:hypothetical protein